VDVDLAGGETSDVSGGEDKVGFTGVERLQAITVILSKKSRADTGLEIDMRFMYPSFTLT
jgi:hypothetical protein